MQTEKFSIEIEFDAPNRRQGLLTKKGQVSRMLSLHLKIENNFHHKGQRKRRFLQTP